MKAFLQTEKVSADTTAYCASTFYNAQPALTSKVTSEEEELLFKTSLVDLGTGRCVLYFYL